VEPSVELGRAAQPDILAVARARLSRGLTFLVHDPPLLAATTVLAVLVFLAIFGRFIWTTNPLAISVGSSLEGPSWAHPMGTDGVGRDVFARFNDGAGISLSVGGIVAILGALVGGSIGVVSGATGGRLDALLMRSMDALLAFPPLVLAMAVTIGLGSGVHNAAIGIMPTSVPYYARLLRSEVLRIRSLPFIEAARALGARRGRIMLRHIVPHVVSTLLIQAAAVFGYAVLTLAALGFVGLGARVPTPEWGAMITDGLQYVLTGQWWIGVFPGLGVLLAVTAASIIADRARDILDPRGQYANL
jgi:peptide/nickel transport system permease protein